MRVDVVIAPMRIKIAAKIPAQPRIFLVHGHFATALCEAQGRGQPADASAHDCDLRSGDFGLVRRNGHFAPLSTVNLRSRTKEARPFVANIANCIALSWVETSISAP